MASQQGKGKKKRTHKVSEGLRKHAKHPLTAVQKVLLSKGQMASIEAVIPEKSHRQFMEAIQRKVEMRWLAEQASARRQVRAEELAETNRIREAS